MNVLTYGIPHDGFGVDYDTTELFQVVESLSGRSDAEINRERHDIELCIARLQSRLNNAGGHDAN